MTYYVKRNILTGLTHLFENKKAFCTGEKHDNYKMIKKGLHLKLTTCQKCLDKSHWYINRDVNEVIEEITNEKK